MLRIKSACIVKRSIFVVEVNCVFFTAGTENVNAILTNFGFILPLPGGRTGEA
jgi:hypothetical protein